MKYNIVIEEMVSQEFEIEAKCIETALEMAEEYYKKGKWVLEPGNLVCKQMYAESNDGKEVVDWYEF